MGKLCRAATFQNDYKGSVLLESIQNNTVLPSDLLLSIALAPENISLIKENVLDGYPKYEHEVAPLVETCDARQMSLRNLYIIQPPLNILLERLNDRYTCDPCYLPLKAQEICPCGGEPFKREEDTEEYFLQRYGRFVEHSGLVINALTKKCQEVIHVETN